MLEKHFARRFLRERTLPTAFCPGCGCGTVINCFLKAVLELGYTDLKGFAFCSGIGCSAWIPSPYFNADSFHSLHGRAIPVAMGIKLVKPGLKVVVFGGDGDIAGIGVGHLVHAARRNVELVVIMVNNFVYGMTGGQVSPTTPLASYTTTTPYGNIEPPMDVANLVKAAGAPFVARWTTYHVYPLKESIKTALQKRCFAFIEAVSQCPTQYGRRMGFKSASEMLKWFRDNSIHVSRAQSLKPEELKNKIVVGVLEDVEKPGFVSSYYEMLRRVKGVAAG